MSRSRNRSADSAYSPSRDFCSGFGSVAPGRSAKFAGQRQGFTRNLAPFCFLVARFGKHEDFLRENLLQASSLNTITILISVTCP